MCWKLRAKYMLKYLQWPIRLAFCISPAIVILNIFPPHWCSRLLFSWYLIHYKRHGNRIWKMWCHFGAKREKRGNLELWCCKADFQTRQPGKVVETIIKTEINRQGLMWCSRDQLMKLLHVEHIGSLLWKSASIWIGLVWLIKCIWILKKLLTSALT